MGRAEATRQGLTRRGFSKDPVEGPVMLRAAKHLRRRRANRPAHEMLRCPQHDRRDGVAPGNPLPMSAPGGWLPLAPHFGCPTLVLPALFYFSSRPIFSCNSL